MGQMPRLVCVFLALAIWIPASALLDSNPENMWIEEAKNADVDSDQYIAASHLHQAGYNFVDTGHGHKKKKRLKLSAGQLCVLRISIPPPSGAADAAADEYKAKASELSAKTSAAKSMRRRKKWSSYDDDSDESENEDDPDEDFTDLVDMTAKHAQRSIENHHHRLNQEAESSASGKVSVSDQEASTGRRLLGRGKAPPPATRVPTHRPTRFPTPRPPRRPTLRRRRAPLPPPTRRPTRAPTCHPTQSKESIKKSIYAKIARKDAQRAAIRKSKVSHKKEESQKAALKALAAIKSKNGANPMLSNTQKQVYTNCCHRAYCRAQAAQSLDNPAQVKTKGRRRKEASSSSKAPTEAELKKEMKEDQKKMKKIKTEIRDDEDDRDDKYADELLLGLGEHITFDDIDKENDLTSGAVTDALNLLSTQSQTTALTTRDSDDDDDDDTSDDDSDDDSPRRRKSGKRGSSRESRRRKKSRTLSKLQTMYRDAKRTAYRDEERIQEATERNRLMKRMENKDVSGIAAIRKAKGKLQHQIHNLGGLLRTGSLSARLKRELNLKGKTVEEAIKTVNDLMADSKGKKRKLLVKIAARLQKVKVLVSECMKDSEKWKKESPCLEANEPKEMQAEAMDDIKQMAKDLRELQTGFGAVLHQKEVLKTDRFEHKLVTTMRTREEGIGKALGQENKVYEKFKDCSGYDCSPEARARKHKSKGLLLIQEKPLEKPLEKLQNTQLLLEDGLYMPAGAPSEAVEEGSQWGGSSDNKSGDKKNGSSSRRRSDDDNDRKKSESRRRSSDNGDDDRKKSKSRRRSSDNGDDGPRRRNSDNKSTRAPTKKPTRSPTNEPTASSGYGGMMGMFGGGKPSESQTAATHMALANAQKEAKDARTEVSSEKKEVEELRKRYKREEQDEKKKEQKDMKKSRGKYSSDMKKETSKAKKYFKAAGKERKQLARERKLVKRIKAQYKGKIRKDEKTVERLESHLHKISGMIAAGGGRVEGSLKKGLSTRRRKSSKDDAKEASDSSRRRRKSSKDDAKESEHSSKESSKGKGKHSDKKKDDSWLE